MILSTLPLHASNTQPLKHLFNTLHDEWVDEIARVLTRLGNPDLSRSVNEISQVDYDLNELIPLEFLLTLV